MMKRALLLWIGISGLAMAADSDFLIQNYRVGRVSADMAPAEAAKQYPANRVKWWEPYPRVHVVDIDPSTDPTTPPAIRMHLDRDQKNIWLISVADKRYHTSKGISIGSSFGSLRKAHPRVIIRTEEGEMDRFIIAEIRGEGISCELQYDDTTWRKMQDQPDRQNVALSIIPDDKVIQSLSVIRRPL